ncbi:hypothetical protein DdX_05445 [Ditylenchus destructor]|uniref:Uncharacterized protein n=1 Tax=Ditylenchus destructor TaxID=166010 RepID=A0AAD4N7M1_9BILA|nr:hypothetical protein DdX_05445 [Ditylenchus destructor]
MMRGGRMTEVQGAKDLRGGSFISHPVSIGAMVFLVILVGALIVGLIILCIIRKRRQKRRIKGLKSYNENMNKVMYADVEGRARLREKIEESVETENSSEAKKE